MFASKGSADVKDEERWERTSATGGKHREVRSRAAVSRPAAGIIPQMSTSAQICDTFMLVARLLLTPLIDRSQLGNKLTRNFMLLTQNVTTKTTSYYWNKTENW